MSATVEEIEKTKVKKAELLLDSLEIRGYRCFEHLTIEKLGRVNLIVGKNNVGKTALLEALWIYANPDDSEILRKIVQSRNEVTIGDNITLESLKEFGIAFRNMFCNRPQRPQRNQFRKDSSVITISQAIGVGEQLETRFLNIYDDVGDIHRREALRDLSIETKNNKTLIIRYFFDEEIGSPTISFFPTQSNDINNLFVSSAGLSSQQQLEFWETITLTPLEDEVINALHILLPQIRRIDFIGYPSGSQNRVPIVRLENEKERVPLKSFGEGMGRLLGISMALVQCQNGMLFIDEIESGLHYSVLPDVWKLIFKTAKDLNVQVFATTHSKDCIEAFAEAAFESPEDGMLVRLERQGEKIVAKTIEEEMLVDAVNYGVEVR